MELLGNGIHREFTRPPRQSRQAHLEGIIGVLGWIATVDAFQHWIYTHPGHSCAERFRRVESTHGSVRGRRGLDRLREVRANLVASSSSTLNWFYYIGIRHRAARPVAGNCPRLPVKVSV